MSHAPRTAEDALLPTTMSAVVADPPGGAEALSIVSVNVPAAAAGEVLIAVEAAGVNRPDIMQREGRYPPPPGATPVLGLEVAGTVVALGEGVEEQWKGRRVCALVAGGGYAEYCTAPILQCLPIPDGVSMVEAGALPEACFTVWANVFEAGELRAGEVLLVHGGASGIGTTAILMARALGARVLATAGDDIKCSACHRLGAELAVNYRREAFEPAVMRQTEGRGVDVVLDMVGGDYTARNLEIVAPRGRIVQIAVLGGVNATINLFTLMKKRVVLTGSTLRARSVAEKGRIRNALASVVWPHVAAGAIRPVIDSTVPLRAVRDAHERMESGRHIGKIVLTN